VFPNELRVDFSISVMNVIGILIYEIFSKMDHILVHRISLDKYKKIEITPCILSDHNAIKLEFNNKTKSRKY
jgi:hypothetical protein